MTDSKFNDLTAVTTLDDADIVAISKAGALGSRKITVANLRAALTPSQQYLGYDVVGGTTEVLGSGVYKNFAKQFTLSEAGLLISVDAYVNGNASNGHTLNAFILNDNAGVSGNVIGYMSWETMTSVVVGAGVWNTTPRWVAIPMSMWLPAGTYWMNVHAGNQITLRYDAGGSDRTGTGGGSWAYDTSQNNAFSNSGRTYSLRASVLA